MQYDTVHGTFAGSISGDDAAKELTVDGKKIQVIQEGHCSELCEYLSSPLCATADACSSCAACVLIEHVGARLL